MVREDRIADCIGLTLDDVVIPPFELGAGEVIQLRFASGIPAQRLFFDDASQLMASRFTQSIRVNTRRTSGRVFYQPAVHAQRGWRRWFRRERELDWLARHSTLTLAEAAMQIRNFGEVPESPIDSIAGDPRAKLGILAALNQDFGVLVFHGIAISSMAKQAVIQAVLDQVGDRAAIYCNTPFVCQGRKMFDEFDFPFAQTIEVPQVTATNARRAG
jgi:hypothetical protein